MAIYRVFLPATAKTIVHDGIVEHVVEAVSSAEALEAVKAVSTKDMDVVWDQATITEQTQDLEGVTFTITVDPGGTPQVFQYVGLANDGWEEVAAALELLCEAVYTSSWTPEATHNMYGTLLIATGSGTDDLGDKVVTATAIGPNAEVLTPEFFQNIVDEGLSTADLTVDILATCPTPRVIGSYK
jgi:hypothetical protein